MEGRPANHGIWSWNDEILVGFSAAYHKVQPNTRHQQDGDKLEAPRLSRSLDGGVTWKLVPYIGPELAGFAIMPSTVRLGTDRLLTAVRVHDEKENRIDSYVSNDNARTWTSTGSLADTGEYGGNPPTLIKLRDGRICLTYGYRAQPYTMRARLSRAGEHWGDIITIREGAPTWEIGYPRSVQRPDEKVVTFTTTTMDCTTSGSSRPPSEIRAASKENS